MGKYILNFKKVVYGIFEIEADNLKDAQERILHEGDEIDNKSDYEFAETEDGNPCVLLDE